jgi:hypothetical protein
LLFAFPIGSLFFVLLGQCTEVVDGLVFLSQTAL